MEAYGPHALLLLQELELEDLLPILVKQIEVHRIQQGQGEGALGQLMQSSSQRPSQENLGLVGQGVLGLEGYILPCSELLVLLEQLLQLLAGLHSLYRLHLVDRLTFGRVFSTIGIAAWIESVLKVTSYGCSTVKSDGS